MFSFGLGPTVGFASCLEQLSTKHMDTSLFMPDESFIVYIIINICVDQNEHKCNQQILI